MGQPDGSALPIDLVDDVLRRHLGGIHVLVDVQAYEVVPLAAEGVIRMQLGTLHQHKSIGCFDAFDSRYIIVIGKG